MTKKARTVLEQALKLSPGDKVTLVDELIANLETAGELELTPDFAAELERRAADSPPRGQKWPTGDEVIEAALRRVKKRRGRRGD